MIKVGVIIPDRGDRPQFTANCVRMIKAQTLTPYRVAHINYPPISENTDIVARYKTGYDLLKDHCDIIAFIETDDWYSPQYLEKMVHSWSEANCRTLFGLAQTIEYHLKFKRLYAVNHPGRSSMHATLMKGGLDFPFEAEMQPYALDQKLWKFFEKNCWATVSLGCYVISMKHGIGLCGGVAHYNEEKFMNSMYSQKESLEFIKQKLDSDSYQFYSSLQI